jgi:hypothetical protein
MKSISEKNEVICRFMGNKRIAGIEAYHVVFGFRNGDTMVKDLEYNISLDWMTPVLNKIRSLGKIITIEIFDEEIVCQVRHDVLSDKADFIASSKTSIAEAVFNAVYDLINEITDYEG